MPVADRIIPFAEQLRRLEAAAPAAFRQWTLLGEVGEKVYKEEPQGSLSVLNHPTAIAFHCYLSRFLQGDVLDIGCGPHKEPIYLQGYPYEKISAIDPLDAKHPFNFIHACAEFIPWADKQFDVVIIATSLDHVLLLDDVLREIERVLKDDGVIVLWEAFFDDAKEYDPYDKNIKPVDKFHLFHFSRDSFAKTVLKYFNVFDEYSLPREYISSFFVLKKNL